MFTKDLVIGFHQYLSIINGIIHAFDIVKDEGSKMIPHCVIDAI